MKQVIEKLKAQQKQNSPQSKPATPKPTKKVEELPVEEEFDEEDEDDEDLDDEAEVEETAQKPQVRKKPAEIPQETGQDKEEISDGDRILMEIEMLQNNGRFRSELLAQFQEHNKTLKEMNKALIVIAGVLVDRNERKKKI